MSPKFRLQRVLDFKQQVEDLLQIEVAAIEGRRLEVQHAIDAMRQKWEETCAAQQPAGAAALDPALLAVAVDYLEALDRRIQASGEVLAGVQQELEAKRAELEAAYQEREALDRLKRKHLAARAKEEQRRDARALEDLATSQHLRAPSSREAG